MDVRNKVKGTASILRRELDRVKAELAETGLTAAEAVSLRAEKVALETELAGLKAGKEARERQPEIEDEDEDEKETPKNPFAESA
jgi:hypothetical protein